MKRILFVGGFSVPVDGTQGGTVFACRSLVDSPLSEAVDWVFIDSTMRSNPPPSIIVRVFDAVRRVMVLVWHLCTSRIDAVLVFSSLGGISIYEKGLMCALAKLGGKTVVISTRSHPILPDRFPRLYQTYVRSCLQLCDTVVCQSRIAADDLVRLFRLDSNRIRVVPNWINVKSFRPVSNALKNREKTQLVYVGWITAAKGMPDLIQAISLLSSERNDFQLAVYGGGAWSKELCDRIERLQLSHVVDFKGWIPNERVPEVLNSSDVFILPTTHEGMPNSLLQAMACRLPVVATNVTSLPEVVEDRKGGFLVPPNSPESIRDAIASLLDASIEQREKMGRWCLNRIRSRHTVDVVWPQMARILQVAS